MIVDFPKTSNDIDYLINQIWLSISRLDGDTSASEIIGALEIVKFDIIEQIKKINEPD